MTILYKQYYHLDPQNIIRLYADNKHNCINNIFIKILYKDMYELNSIQVLIIY